VRAVERLHESHVGGRRVRVLVDHLAELAPRGAHILDVGCGDGLVASELLVRRPDLHCAGIDVLVRPETAIEVTAFDGQHIPFPADAFDSVMLVDVLHHADDPEGLLGEAARVAKHCVLVKDHRLDGPLAGFTLRFMDRVGNQRHAVALPYNYWPEAKWRAEWSKLGLHVENWTSDVGLYVWPLSLVFDRALHFVARLGVG
jgi:SAM-dependent methyltransferase